MDEKTARALEAGIEKWRGNESAETADEYCIGGDNCSLCGLYRGASEDEWCKGCPVMDRTGRRECSGTPYDAAYHAAALWGIAELEQASQTVIAARRDAARKVAGDMVRFLESLRENAE